MRNCRDCNTVLTEENWHDSYKRTKNYLCKACVREKARRLRENGYASQWVENNKSKVQKSQREYYHRNREKRNAANVDYRRINVEKERARKLLYGENNREFLRQYSKQYNKNKPYVAANNSAKRRAIIKKASVPWADHTIIAKIYEAAYWLSVFSGTEWQVDHEIPLQGRTVSGLHVQNNLRIITKEENCKKHSRFSPEELKLK